MHPACITRRPEGILRTKPTPIKPMKTTIERLKHISLAAIGCFAFSCLASPSAHAVSLVCPLGVMDFTANGGINPATGQTWAAGDQYRLVFITSTRISLRSNNINDYNALGQDFANLANDSGTTGPDLSLITWNVLGSTSTVNARTNTGTNFDIDNPGNAIFLMDGASIVANDYADLWSGAIRSSILLNEEGVLIETSGRFPWTGTDSSGFAISGGELRSGTGNIRQGEAANLAGWIDRANSSVLASSSSDQRIYVMSDAITVIPEPSTALLGGLGLLALLRRRR